MKKLLKGTSLHRPVVDWADELLAILVEDAAEVVHAAIKLKRHGLSSVDPTNKQSRTNQVLLTFELGQLAAAVEILVEAGVVDREAVRNCTDQRLMELATSRYVHCREVRRLAMETYQRLFFERVMQVAKERERELAASPISAGRHNTGWPR